MAQHDATASRPPYPEAFPVTASGGYDGRATARRTTAPTISWASMWRIALAVCIGVLAAGAISALVAVLFLGHALSGIDDSTGTDSSSTAGLSSACTGAIDNNESSATVQAACSDDDTAAVLAYESQAGYAG